MKKTFSKVIAALLVVMMAIAMIPSAFAAVTIDSTTDRVITITNKYTSGENTIDSKKLTFTVYKVADITQSDNKLVYTPVSGATFSKTPSGESVAADVTINREVTGIVATYNNDNKFTAKVGKANGLYLIKPTAKPTNVKSMESVLVQVPNMYNGAKEWQYTAEVSPKAVFQTTSSDKNIVTASGLADRIDVQGAKGTRAGDNVKFQLEAAVLGENTEEGRLKSFVLKDTISKGLTFNAGTVKVIGVKDDNTTPDVITDSFDTKEAAYTETDKYKGGKVISFEAKADFLASDIYEYKTIQVEYLATVNEYAVMGSAGNPNKSHLEYANATDSNQTEDTEVNVYTYGVQIKKVDSDGTKALQGAKFQIKNTGGVVLDEQTSDANGLVNFERLAPGTYKVVEIKAPANYQLLKDEITVKLTKDNATTNGMYQITVTNSKFATPVTGGIGSIVFVVAGLSIMGLGAFLFFKSRKKNESK